MRRIAENERKALRVLLIIFSIFVCMWSPFFFLNTLSAVVDERVVRNVLVDFESTVYAALTWLGYSSSMFNPIVYTIFNKTFRAAFVNILACRVFCCSSSSSALDDWHKHRHGTAAFASLRSARNSTLTSGKSCRTRTRTATTTSTIILADNANAKHKSQRAAKKKQSNVSLLSRTTRCSSTYAAIDVDAPASNTRICVA